MNSVRMLDELVARCVSIVVAYRGEGVSRNAYSRMAKDVHDVAREIMGWGMRASDVECRVLDVVGVELSSRYGDGSSRIYKDFLKAFEEEAGLRMNGSGHTRALHISRVNH